MTVYGKIKIAAVSCLAAALILSGCNGAKGPTVYATVNGLEITQEDYQLYENFLRLPQHQVELTREDQEQILQDLVDLKVYVAEAEKRGFEPDIDRAETDFKAYREQVLETDLFAGSLAVYYARLQEYGLSEDWIIQLYKDYQIINAMIDAEEAKAEAPDSEDIEAYYEKEKETTFSHDELRRVRHILVNEDNFPDSEGDKSSEVKELATSLYQRLKAGEDFALLAKEYSQDGSATLGGDIGFVGKEGVVQSFGDAAFSAELNVVVPPVESQYGWHVLEVTEIKAPGYYELDEDMRERIADSLLKTAKQKLVDNLLQGLKEDADIIIYF